MVAVGTRTRGSACGCCGDPCLIGTDLFDGSLSQWTVTGSASTSGGLLEMTSGDTVIFTPVPATADDGVRVQTFPLTADATATVRLIAAWTDANNYLFGELAIAAGAGTIRLGQVSGGVSTYLTAAETLEDTGSELNARSILTLCCQPGATQTPTSGSTASAPSVATNGGSWTDQDFILEDDTNYAQWGGSFNPTEETNQISASGFTALTIPPGSTIDGIAVDVLHADLGTDAAYVVDSLVRLQINAVAVGDNKAEETLIGGSDPQLRSYGGAADDWNWGGTWRDIETLGVTLKYRNDGVDDAATVIVDYVEVTIWYTTPDRKPGRLQFTYTNTASPNTVQCQTAFDAFSTGMKTGIAVTAGDWDFTTYDLQYLQHDTLHPTCPECDCPDTNECDFCDPEPKAFQRIDLGAVGGNLCDGFPNPSGEYVIEATSECEWLYIETTPCDNADLPFACGQTVIVFSLKIVPSGATAKWLLGYYQLPNGAGGCSFTSPCACPDSQYESADLATLADCQTYPVTLTRISGSIGPASITLEAA